MSDDGQPAADAGPLLSGCTPLATSLISFLYLGERQAYGRLIGVSCIAGGALALVASGVVPHSEMWVGQLLLVMSAFGWAIYTLAFPRTGMSAMAMSGLVSIWSTVVLLPLGLPGILAMAQDGSWNELAQLTLVQGIGSGLVAFAAFGVAIDRLGTARAAAFPGLVPAVAALLGIVFLGEQPHAVTWIGILAAGVGVVMASGALGDGRR